MLKDDLPTLFNEMRSAQATRSHNAELFDIFEGLLLPYVLKELETQLSPQSFNVAKQRVAPVNVLKQMIAKLSQIYLRPPRRTLKDPSEKDSELFNYYLTTMDPDTNMGQGNEFFNLFKNTLVEPYVKDRKPALRMIPSDRFFVYSNKIEDPTDPTHVVKMMGKRKKLVGKDEVKEVEVYFVYTDEEFLAVDSDMEILTDIMAQNNNPGVNIYGKLPFVYINRSRHQIIPPIDSDTLKMSKIIPILLSDLNYAVQFQSFSVIYGIDISDENINMAPNAFWRFKSDPTSDKTPSIGSIKPQVDISQVVSFITAQLALWLQSRGIRPGGVGDLGADNFASGISKIVDEMDTYEDRAKQIPFFKTAEEDLWKLIVENIHPVWVQEDLIDQRLLFDAGQEVQVQFPEQKPLVRRLDILAEIEKELSLGLSTRKDAMHRLNPDLTEQEVEEKLQEVETKIEVPENGVQEEESQETQEVV